MTSNLALGVAGRIISTVIRSADQMSMNLELLCSSSTKIFIIFIRNGKSQYRILILVIYLRGSAHGPLSRFLQPHILLLLTILG